MAGVEATGLTAGDAVKAAVSALRSGGMVVLVDDPDRENEGDVIGAAEHATPQMINFMASQAKGLICMPMDPEYTKKLSLPQMVSDNRDNYATAFTVSIDHVDATTGISARERSMTARKCAEENSRPEDFKRPGHMFPLEAKPGGVLERRGHTEATIGLLRLAGLKPVGLCCEIMDDGGGMLAGPGLDGFAREHRMPLIRICDLVYFMERAGTEAQC